MVGSALNPTYGTIYNRGLAQHWKKSTKLSLDPIFADAFSSLSAGATTVQEDDRIVREREAQEQKRQKRQIDRLAKQVKVRNVAQKRFPVMYRSPARQSYALGSFMVRTRSLLYRQHMQNIIFQEMVTLSFFLKLFPELSLKRYTVCTYSSTLHFHVMLIPQSVFCYSSGL